MSRHSLSRRSMLASLPALTAVSGRSEAADRRHPDRELLALGREFETAWTAERAVCEAERGNETAESEERTDAALSVTEDVVDRIEMMRARTVAGLRVKARAVSWCFNGGTVPVATSPFTADRLAFSIARDLLAGDAG